MKYVQNILLTGLLFEALWILPFYLIKCSETYQTSMWTAVQLTRLPREFQRNKTTLWNV